MKNHAKPHAGADGKEHDATKEAQHVPPHGYGHAREKAGKHVPHGKPVPAEPNKSAEEPPDEDSAKKLADLEDRHLRLLADFDNYRKRSLREKETAARLMRENMLMEFLPVIDSIELGINSAHAHKMDKAFVDGYRMISDQLSATLARFGLAPQDAQGAQFDANVHEAVQHVPSEEYPAGTVMAVVRKGYLSGDAVLRPAQVVVSSGSASAAPVVGEAAAEETEVSVEQPAGEPPEEATEE